MIKRLFYGFQLFISALLLFSVVAQDAVANDMYINTGPVNINGVGNKITIPFGQYLYAAGSPIATNVDPLYPYAVLHFDCSQTCSDPQGAGDGIPIRAGTEYLMVSMGIRSAEGTDTWGTLNKSSSPVAYGDASGTPIATIISTSKMTFAGTVTVNNLHLAAIRVCPTSRSEDNCKEIGQLYLNAKINIEHSACSITTPHDMAFVWTALSPSAVANGTAGEKVATISMSCKANPTPISVTFTSTNGNYDATNGIVNTDKANLGIQLSWQKTGNAIQLGQEMDIPAENIAATDFNISAKPVQTGEGKISGGAFSTAVTMSVEYR